MKGEDTLNAIQTGEIWRYQLERKKAEVTCWMEE